VNANLTVREMMETVVHTVPPDMLLPALEKEFFDKKASGFPVVENGQLVGMVSRSDIVRQLAEERQLAQTTSDFYWDDSGFHEDPAKGEQQIATRVGQRIEELRVKEMMSQQVVVVSPDDSIELAAEKLMEHRIQRVPVVDGGRLVGVITALQYVQLFAEHRVKVV